MDFWRIFQRSSNFLMNFSDNPKGLQKKNVWRVLQRSTKAFKRVYFKDFFREIVLQAAKYQSFKQFFKYPFNIWKDNFWTIFQRAKIWFFFNNFPKALQSPKRGYFKDFFQRVFNNRKVDFLKIFQRSLHALNPGFFKEIIFQRSLQAPKREFF